MARDQPEGRERNRLYAQVLHAALEIMRGMPSGRPRWAVERLAERAARMERFIDMSGMRGGWERFDRAMDDEEASLLREAPGAVHVPDDEIDDAVARILGWNDGGRGNDGTGTGEEWS